jgi:glycosyltransferase involved in cell wall biosynthesis
MNNELISVIIPVYNGEKYLAESIRSVLGQTCRHFEIIIIDDGSTDSTAQIAHEFADQNPVQYFHQKNQGLAASRNQGISVSSGDLIAFNDADDLWIEDKLESQWKVFQKNPKIEMVSGKVKQFISPEIPQKDHADYHFHPGEVQTNMMGAALIRRSAFSKYGLFNPAYHIGQDMDWVLQAKLKGLKIEPLQQLVYYRRLHPGNLGRQRAEENYKTRFQILKNAVDLRRSKNS